MSSEEDGGSVSQWLGDLKAGDPAAAQPLWERYFARLVGLARTRLRANRRGAATDEEDAALSAFHSFCEGAAQGRFPNLADRDDLWRLLVVITARKAGAHAERESRQKRGGGKIVSSSDSDDDLFARVVSSEPSPEFAAMAAEECRRLLAKLDDDELRKVALDRMEGYTNDEIAERLGCARRTVARRLEFIRQAWEAEGA